MGIISSCATKNQTATVDLLKPIPEEEEENPEKNSQLLIKGESSAPSLKLHPISSKNASMTLSNRRQTFPSEMELEWDVYFSRLGVFTISAVFEQTDQPPSPFDIIIKICGKLFIYKYEAKTPGQGQLVIESLGRATISEFGTRIISAKLLEVEKKNTPNLKYIDLRGSGVEAARDLSPTAHLIVAFWHVPITSQYFYTGVEVLETFTADTVFGVCWFQCAQFGLRDCYGKKSIWFNVSPDKSVGSRGFEIAYVDKQMEMSKYQNESRVTVHNGSLPFEWCVNTHYQVLVNIDVDDAFQKYSVYFYLPTKGEKFGWQKIVVIKFSANKFNHNPDFGSFVEDKTRGRFVEALDRKANYGPSWYRTDERWSQVDNVSVQDKEIFPGSGVKKSGEKVCMFIGKVPENEKSKSTLSLQVENKLPAALQSLPE